ncbi:transcriptional repressor [Flavobacterium sp.]|uniref:Fur family transcriptional regulator n=1 Tax=Flavobacterium sp. TaxID=239 RepID=UPI00260D59F8|nr:transcriptional repressor [Flavobacterium sp.]
MRRRNTPAKEAVLDVLKKAGKALNHETVQDNLSIDIDRATVYRVLNRFCDDGILHRVVAEDGKQYFAVCSKCDSEKHSDNHFHFRCTGCNTLECLPTPVQFTVPEGYFAESINCIINGRCKNCA